MVQELAMGDGANRKHAVVISGAAGRFPSSASLDEFKENLLKSVDMVTADDSRWPVGKCGCC